MVRIRQPDSRGTFPPPFLRPFPRNSCPACFLRSQFFLALDTKPPSPSVIQRETSSSPIPQHIEPPRKYPGQGRSAGAFVAGHWPVRARSAYACAAGSPHAANEHQPTSHYQSHLLGDDHFACVRILCQYTRLEDKEAIIDTRKVIEASRLERTTAPSGKTLSLAHDYAT